MKTVELSAALGQAQVVENLKNFVGVDAQGAAALMTPERLAAVAGEFLSKKLLTAEDDLNNIPDGWYYYMNTVNPQNTPQYADNSLLYQISVVDTRTFRFQILLSENAKCVFFRGMANGGEWTVWNRFSFVLKQ